MKNNSEDQDYRYAPKDWRTYYILPLSMDKLYMYAFDNTGNVVISPFRHEFDSTGDYTKGDAKRIEKIIKIINGCQQSDFEPEWGFVADDPFSITYKGKFQFRISGFENVTSWGSRLKLPRQLAVKVQAGFILYILNRLNNNTL